MKSKLLLITMIVMLSSSSLLSYVFDIEVAGFTSPSVVKADTGRFSDARYAMADYGIGILLRNKGTLDVTAVKIDYRIYIEDTDGTFSKLVFNCTQKVDITSGDSTELVLPAFGDDNSFTPQPYGELGGKYPEESIPGHFRTMLNNVTPRYLVVVKAQDDQDTTNNTISETFRFFIQYSTILVSAEYSYADIENETDPDVIAGKLNSDSLCSAFLSLGYMQGDDPVRYDFFDRKGWEPGAVDYSQYRTLYWSDADENPLAQSEKENLTNYLETEKLSGTKNLMICSQEMFRMNWDTDSNWVKNTIYARKYPANPTDPNGGAVYSTEDNPERYLIGMMIAHDVTIPVRRTSFPKGDPGPVPGLLSLNKEGEGLMREALRYNSSSVICPEPVETTAGSAISSIFRSIVYLAVDWRHIGDNEVLLRGLIDYINRNGMYYALSVSPDTSVVYPGDSVIYKVKTVNVTLLNNPQSMTLKVYNQLNNKYDTLRTGTDGNGRYVVNIPENTTPGLYRIRFSGLKSEISPFNAQIQYITVLSDSAYADSAYVTGDYDVCAHDTVIYKTCSHDRKFSWTTSYGGEIIGSKTDSVVKVVWNNSEEAVLTLKQTIVSSGVTKTYKYEVYVYSSPEKPKITRRDDTLFSSSEWNNTWLLDGKVIPGETNNFLFPKEPGVYSVFVTSGFGCKSPVSNMVDFISGVEDEAENPELTVFPNPAVNYIVVAFKNNSLHQGKIQITDVLGNIVYESKIENDESTGSHTIDTNSFAPGMYFVTFSNSSNTMVTRFLLY